MKNSLLSQILEQSARARCKLHLVGHTHKSVYLLPLGSEQHRSGEAGQGQVGGDDVDTYGPEWSD